MEQQQSVEELSKDYADNKVPNPNPNDAPYYTTGDKWDDLNEAFKAGFLAASPKGKEEDELKELRAWKESAMRVMPDFQAIGKELGLKLGDTVHDKILPAIINYKKQLGITD